MRTLLVPVFALAVALLAGGALLTADEKGKGDAHDHHGAYDACAKACSDCQRSCDSCATHCAMMVAQGKKEHLQSLQTCQDCATLCSAASSITARRGPFSDTICTACAEACKRCGDTCAKMSDDAHMKQCADECRRCEKACRDMLTHVGGGKATTR